MSCGVSPMVSATTWRLTIDVLERRVDEAIGRKTTPDRARQPQGEGRERCASVAPMAAAFRPALRDQFGAASLVKGAEKSPGE
jgi:hypothetical protein